MASMYSSQFWFVCCSRTRTALYMAYDMPYWSHLRMNAFLYASIRIFVLKVASMHFFLIHFGILGPEW